MPLFINFGVIMFEGILKQFKPWQKENDAEYKEQVKGQHDSIAAPRFDDGAQNVEANDQTAYNGFVQQVFSNQAADIKTTRQLIDTYRNLMNNPEVDNAVQEIVDDAIVYEDGHDVVSLDLDATEFSANIKDKLLEEFKSTLNTIGMDAHGADNFRRWYVDSRIFFHKIIDPRRPKEGLVELRRLDPRNMEFVREVVTEEENGIKIFKGYREYFIYDTGGEQYCVGGRTFNANSKIKIPRQAIVYAHSGLLDCCGKNIIGYLHRAVKPANQLKLLEDAMVIYRITRAPERRVWYIDTGNMPSRKASQHMMNIMTSLKNKVVYDSSTGKIKNQQHNMSMTEDFYLQRRDGKAVTDVTPLPGASGMNEIDDVKWFNTKLFQALKIPLGRMPNADGGGIQLGGTGMEITQEELKFAKFIRGLQKKFSPVIMDPFKTNVIAKRILTKEEFEEQLNNIKLVFHKDSYFTEIRDAEVMERRFNMLQLAEPAIGKYMSHRTAMKEILKMSDEQIEQEQKLIDEESKIERFKPEEQEEF